MMDSQQKLSAEDKSAYINDPLLHATVERTWIMITELFDRFIFRVEPAEDEVKTMLVGLLCDYQRALRLDNQKMKEHLVNLREREEYFNEKRTRTR